MSSAEIVRKILKQSPPNELKEVLEDLKVLTEIDQDDLNGCLKEFNEQQLNTIDLDGVRTLITPQSHINHDKYYDPKSSKVYKLNQLDLKAENVETVDQLNYQNHIRSLLEHALDEYVEEFYSNGTAAVYTTVKCLDNMEQEQEQELEKEQNQVEQTDEAVNESGEKLPEEGDSENEENSEEQQDAGKTEQQEESSPKESQDKLEEAQPNPVDEPAAQNTQETKSEDISEINLYYTGNKFNQSNYWSGRWRARWVYDLTSDEIVGNIDISIHYFENGNVQLQASHAPKIKSPLQGPPTTPEEAKKLVKAIIESDRQYQAHLNVLYQDKLSEKLFKSLRRALPITREKIDWDKVVNYKLGSELGKLNS
ncbi:hypothetical protein E3P92_03582 [Wallemia ichthyophaga]|uniref:F-actin-capping protein subunit alpha n=1 Tax=Wallemia ichthyophaga (strain EXF-994 / CBS 113033) TaxID=1299270 RepID=R9AG08_WALI9|nr:F-actin-capping protein subunit alpha [Wallemia ichthyophaga EXF-994]EOR01107.1 F-actin-capping protein subunit alpha [Wallemia ichthyophaga EXF-994]TIB09087.1 hypothetical protein E3P92_03582 [Wallemia ichthyophaga]